MNKAIEDFESSEFWNQKKLPQANELFKQLLV